MRIKWNRPGERFYEAGVDRGVLYPLGGDGVPWNGLISVEEKVSGGEVEPLHYDGFKYIDIVAGEDYQGTITAFTYPEEFEECDGTRVLTPGMLVTRQPRKPFGLCYRTQLGNDLHENSYAYKLHLVYNIMASPSTKVHKTLTNTPELVNFKWDINATPPRSSIFKPTAHIIVDSSETPPDQMRELEDILYGTSSNPAQLPDQSTVYDILYSDGTDYDAGYPDSTYREVLDGGTPSDPYAVSTGTTDGNDQ